MLPFGLSPAPYVFTKVMRQPTKYWRQKGIRIVLYIDDGLGGAGTFNRALTVSQQVKSDLISCGFTPNQKSVWIPTQELIWLGHVLNFREATITVTQEKILKLKQDISFAVSFKIIKAQKLASIAGQIISMSMAIGNLTRLMTRSIFSCIARRKNWSSNLQLDSDALNELNFWLSRIDENNRSPMLPQSSCVGIVYSDASETGFGGYLVKCGEHEVTGSWQEHQKLYSSTLRELLAVKYVIISLIAKLNGSSIKWYTNNKNVALILNISSKKQHLQSEIMQIFNICYPRSINIDIEWIPRTQNERADYLSKIYDDNDWGISDILFNWLEELWGPHSIDRFANYLNTKLPRYNSRYWNPGSESIDTFVCDWGHENNYVCPPIPLVSRVLLHAKNCNAQGTLIVPAWFSAPFWSLLLSEFGDTFNFFIKDIIELPTAKEFYATGTCNSIFGKEDLKFRMLALRFDFSQW